MVECVDPDTLLEWLQTGVGEERDIQLMALEQLCMLLLMSDNIDRCFENCPPRNFLPALCRIILDETAPDNILEVTARAITYYLDVSQDVLKRILSVEGSVRGICNRLASADMNSRTSKDLAEQCVKILELICQRDADVVFKSGGLETMLNFVVNHGRSVHKDTFYSSMSVVSKLCTKIDPVEQPHVIETCTTRLSQLLKTSEDQNIIDNVLRCFVSISDRCVRKNVSTEVLTNHGLVDYVIHALKNYNRNLNATAALSHDTASPSVPGRQLSAHHPSCSIILNLIASLCRGSQKVTDDLLTDSATKLKGALQNILSQKEERLLLDSLWFIDFILTILIDGRQTLTTGYHVGKSSTPSSAAVVGGASYLAGSTPTSRFYNTAPQPESGLFNITDMDRTQRYLTECIRYKDTDSLIEAIENDGIDVNFTDDVGQTLLNWASAFGTVEMVEYLCDKGADVNKGQKSSSLHYAACFGRPQIAKILLHYGANPDLCDEEGKRPLDKSRDRNDNGHKEVTSLLENPGEWMRKNPDSPSIQDTTESSVSVAVASSAIPSLQEQPYQNLTPDYIKFLLPMFAQIYYKHNLNNNLRRLTLQLIDKCLKRMDAKTLKEAADSHGFGQKLVEILSAVLDSEDEGSQYNALCMINEMLNKQSEYFADHFMRLGVVPKIQSLCGQTIGNREETLIKNEKAADRCKDLSSSLLERHFKSTLCGQRAPVQKLHNIIESLFKCINSEIDDDQGYLAIFRQCFTDLKHMLMDDDALSSYELYSSGLIDVLLTLAPYLCDEAPMSKNSKFFLARQAFDDIFCIDLSSAGSDDRKSDQQHSPLDMLIRKLVTCLENAEKFPQYIYDSLSSGSHVPRPAFLAANGGFQMLNKRFRFTLQKNDKNDRVPDRSGRLIRAEALVTAGQLKTYLSRIVSAQPIASDNFDHKDVNVSSSSTQKKNNVTGQAVTDRSAPQVTYATVTSFDSGIRMPLTRSKLLAPITTAVVSTPASLISQKSMSTTNLLDNKDNKANQQSAVTSNQAISAESLQNPTASLENLIARSRWREVQQPPLPEASCESSSTDAAEGDSFQTLASCQGDSQEMLSSHQTATVKYFRSRSGRKSMSSSNQDQESSDNCTLSKGFQSKGRGRRYSTAGDITGSANSKVSSIDESGEKESQSEVDAGGMFKSFFSDADPNQKYLVTPCEMELNPQDFAVKDPEDGNHPRSSDVAPHVEELCRTESPTISSSTPNLSNEQKRFAVMAANEQNNPTSEAVSATPMVTIAAPSIDSIAVSRTKNLSVSSSSDDEALQHLLDTFATLTARARQRPMSETMDPGLLNIGDLVELGGDLATSGEVLSLVKAAVQAELEACVNILPPIGSRTRNERKTIDSTAGNLETSTSSAASTLASALSARRAQVLAEMEEDDYGDIPVGGAIDDDDPLSYDYDDMGAYGAADEDYANDEDEYYPAPPSQFADTTGYETVFPERSSCRRRRSRHAAVNSGSSQETAVSSDATADAGGATKFTVVKLGASSSASLKFQQRLANHMLMNNKRKTGGVTSAAAAVVGLGSVLDDDYVLKRQFKALLPAFDPRPGRSNVNQMQDIDLPPPVEIGNETTTPETAAPVQSDTQLQLYLKIGWPQTKDDDKSCGATILLTDDHKCLFYYIQQLALENLTSSSKTDITVCHSKVEKLKTIFDQTYVIFYQTESKTEDAKSQDLMNFSGNSMPGNGGKKIAPEDSSMTKLINTLQLLKYLRKLSSDDECSISKKLTEKLRQQLRDVLVVAGDSLPDWCDRLMFDFPFLFPFDCRQMYLKSTAFGATRSICWLQSQSDQRLEQQRVSSSNPSGGILRRTLEESHFFHDYRVGRIKHERVKVDRSDENCFLDWSRRVMDFHAERKSYLEVEFLGEEGTGLGPTLEFYALTAAQLQRKSLALWLCDDETPLDKNLADKPVDLGSGLKPVGYYVRRAGGLFPAPYPARCPQLKQVCKLFRFMGTFIAKVLQDGRLVDLPLSKPFLKFICRSSSDYLLDFRDFELLYPIKAKFLKQLKVLSDKRREISADETLNAAEKHRILNELRLSANGCDVVDEEEEGSYRVEDLGLTFQLNPPSQVYGYEYVNLTENGGSVNVESQNLNNYIDLCTDFYLNSGIKLQLQAFKSGFDRVFPMDRLRSFIPEEIQTLISGEQYPKWTAEDIVAHTEPKLGYSKDSPGFQRFVEVLCEMTGEERKSFLQFTTGCSSLPPGGLMNLHPPLTIVRKVDASDGSYPSVNTCVHYLKLPEYTSKEILKKRLMYAMSEKGFHLN